MGSNFIWPYATPALYSPLPWPEGSFDVASSRDWMEANWHKSLYIVLIYMVAAAFGEQWMKNRKPFVLQTPLVLWNMSMALFSIVGFIRCLPELIHVLLGENGFHRSVCVR